MNDARKAAILRNDLDTMAHLIEDMPAAPEYTDALVHIQAARQAIVTGLTRLHHEAMAERNRLWRIAIEEAMISGETR